MRHTTFTTLIKKMRCTTKEDDNLCKIYDHDSNVMASVNLKDVNELKVMNSNEHLEIGYRLIKILEICIKFAKTPLNER